MNLQRAFGQTPLGEVILLADHRRLVALMWADGVERTEQHLFRHLGPWRTTNVGEIPAWSSALDAYWAGDHNPFRELPLIEAGTVFQQRVWAALRTIPWGSTWSYRELSNAIAHPNAHRAVASANGRNPIPIVTPCHRVIASNGGLGGFSGGLDKKRFLLGHEGQRHWGPVHT